MIKEEFSSVTIICDPQIEPYFIGKDSYCYTIYETITPDVKYTESNKVGKEYTKPMGHYSNFGNCLKAIARLKTDNKQKYSSIQEYIETFTQTENIINQLVKNKI